MIGWFKARLERRRLRLDKRAVIKELQRFMKEHWDEGLLWKPFAGATSHFSRTWIFHGYILEIYRQPRGDLIELKSSEGKYTAADWVDQSHAYPGFLGLNDVKINIKHSDVLNLIEEYCNRNLSSRRQERSEELT